MITLRRSEDRGHADHGWLDTYHTFSFADYFDPDHVQFSVLRVINQDRIAPAAGFPTHGHRDMEIITYVIEGALEHRDSMGNGSRILPGEVQIMSAGTGVTHSEFNASRTEPLELLQMWVLPARSGTTPRYEQKAFPDAELSQGLRLVVSPDARDGSLTIRQDARMYAGRLAADQTVRHRLPSGRSAWLHVARGSLALGDLELGPGDGAAIRDQPEIQLRGRTPADLVLFDLP